MKRVEPTRRQVCTQCKAVILGFVAVVEVSRYTARGGEQDRFLVCGECADRIVQTLGRPPDATGPDAMAVRLLPSAR